MPILAISPSITKISYETHIRYWSIPISHLCLYITNANFVICDLRRSDVERIFLAHRDTKKGALNFWRTGKKYSARPQVLVR